MLIGIYNIYVKSLPQFGRVEVGQQVPRDVRADVRHVTQTCSVLHRPANKNVARDTS